MNHLRSLARTLDDRLAVIAACSTVGATAASEPVEPLGPEGWSRVAVWLASNDLTPAHLLDERTDLSTLDATLAARLRSIPERAPAVDTELDAFRKRGFWSLVRFDDAYPERWRVRLRRVAPPVMFGAGPFGLLRHTPSLAIVGSRDIGGELADVAMTVGETAGHAGYVVVSGGARGSDRWGMFGALQASRPSVGILHGDLVRDAGKGDTRRYIDNELLTLTTHVHPNTGFATTNAMARNVYIHALVDATVVIATTAGSGGTWQGSQSNLKNGWSPLLVWMGNHAPAGNQALVDAGGFPFSAIPRDAKELRTLIESAAEHHALRSSASPQSVQATLPL
ncbi:MAG: DNA-processing protein DprA [Thermomicrobiales bacterium]|jgi:predicted Rossmann fold nucleotide-binding protein DprA/Smf involved in DNA uptake|nr:DNA-processing protein DprA [Thermomicrobiales bacterium]